jgi:hypothetical protein
MGRAMQAERESASTGAGGKQAGSRIGPVEVSTLGRNGGYMRYRNWRREPGSRRWLIEQRRIGPVIR